MAEARRSAAWALVLSWLITIVLDCKLCVSYAQGKATKESGDKTGSVKTVDGKRAKVWCHEDAPILTFSYRDPVICQVSS